MSEPTPFIGHNRNCCLLLQRDLNARARSCRAIQLRVHPYYCRFSLSTSCLPHEIGKRHGTRCCWRWCFLARRGRYGSRSRGWAIILGRPYWLRCVSAPRGFFVSRPPLFAVIGSSVHHSSRMSLDGSTVSARRAGMADAAIPSRAMVSTAPPRTTGSRGFA